MTFSSESIRLWLAAVHCPGSVLEMGPNCRFLLLFRLLVRTIGTYISPPWIGGVINSEVGRLCTWNLRTMALPEHGRHSRNTFVRVCASIRGTVSGGPLLEGRSMRPGCEFCPPRHQSSDVLQLVRFSQFRFRPFRCKLLIFLPESLFGHGSLCCSI
jgi:hypothetical protein